MIVYSIDTGGGQNNWNTWFCYTYYLYNLFYFYVDWFIILVCQCFGITLFIENTRFEIFILRVSNKCKKVKIIYLKNKVPYNKFMPKVLK